MRTFIQRLKLSLVAVFALGLVVAPAALAAVDIGLDKGGAANTIAGKGGYETAGVTDVSLSQQVGRIIKIALSFVGTIFFALTVYAGFLWMTASGNEEQVAKSQSILRMAAIGLVITMSSYGITYFVLGAIESSSGNASCSGVNCENP